MSRAIVIQLAANELRAVVARSAGNSLQVEASETVPIVGSDIASAGKQLAAALEQHHPAKAKVIVAVPSPAIRWQYLTLPPCPPEDLPAVVKLQLDMEGARDEDPIGYDFLPLEGDGQRPQRILAMTLKMAELARVRNLGKMSGLRIDAVIPAAMGWPSVELQTDSASTEARLFVALENKEATIWVKSPDAIALFRQVQLAEDWQASGSADFIAGQLRRTVWNLAQEGIAADNAAVLVIGKPAASLERLAGALGEQLNGPVLAAHPAEAVLPANMHSDREDFLPLLGLVAQAIRGESPPLDFLHPRKPPVPRSNRRTLVLGGIAAALLAALAGWQGYTSLNDPIAAALRLNDELAEVNRELEPLKAEERDAARIRDWLAASPNVLVELADLSKDWRPHPFGSTEFAVGEDALLKRIDITNRRVVLNGNVSSSAAVQPLENRLRDDGHRVRREQSDAAQDGGQYPWQVQIVMDIVEGQPPEGRQ